jgi:hypothetical protein
MFFTSTAAGAQEKKASAEIGTTLGATILSFEGETITAVGIPVDAGVSILGTPALYATIFATPSLMVEPQLGLMFYSGGGDDVSIIFAAVDVAHLFTPSESSSPYAGLNAAVQSFDLGDESTTGTGLGGRVGYRVRVGAGLAVRFEGHIRMWLGDFDEITEYGFGVGIGGII